jgi:hypothetical protein
VKFDIALSATERRYRRFAAIAAVAGDQWEKP